MKITLCQLNATIREADRLFNRAANAWTRGNNSGDNEYNRKCQKQCHNARTRAEELLAPFGIVVDYPGPYPSFTVGGFSYHSTDTAISAAVGSFEPQCQPFWH